MSGGLVLTGRRVLDPACKCYWSDDRVFNDLSQVAYTANPILFWDPTGEEAVEAPQPGGSPDLPDLGASKTTKGATLVMVGNLLTKSGHEGLQALGKFLIALGTVLIVEDNLGEEEGGEPDGDGGGPDGDTDEKQEDGGPGPSPGPAPPLPTPDPYDNYDDRGLPIYHTGPVCGLGFELVPVLMVLLFVGRRRCRATRRSTGVAPLVGLARAQRRRRRLRECASGSEGKGSQRIGRFERSERWHSS